MQGAIRNDEAGLLFDEEYHGVCRKTTDRDRRKAMKKIEVLGAGCPNCKKLYEMTKETAESLGLEYEIEKVQDMNRILEYNILATPALVVNGEVKVAGRVPNPEEVRKHLSD